MLMALLPILWLPSQVWWLTLLICMSNVTLFYAIWRWLVKSEVEPTGVCLDSYHGRLTLGQTEFVIMQKSHVNWFGVALWLQTEPETHISTLFIWRDSVSSENYSRLVRTIKKLQITPHTLASANKLKPSQK
jgi:hypothetical protein